VRSTWLATANAVVLGWLAATALSVVTLNQLGLPSWLPVHMFLLGAVSSAILVWSEHFAVAVLHARQPARWSAAARLAALNTGTIAILFGRLAGVPWLLAAGAVTLLAAVAELYLGEPGSLEQVAKLRGGEPDAWAFNGAAGGYAQAPLPARVGERVRVWVAAAGPSGGVAFHVVGTVFDTVYKEGGWLLRPGDGTDGGAQVLDLAAAQGGFVELAFPEPGTYPFVDHDLHRGEGGAAGAFTVTG
jgi:FtsP/CotA-like multicopper oxidase with cupredoxin domain